MDKTVAAKDRWERSFDMKLHSVNNKTLCQMNGVNYPTFSNSHRSACFPSNSRRHCSVNNIWSLLRGFKIFFFFRIASKCRSAGFWRRIKKTSRPEKSVCVYAGICLLNVSAMVKDMLCHSHWAAPLRERQICWFQCFSASERHCRSGKRAVCRVRENNEMRCRGFNKVISCVFAFLMRL